MLKRPFWLVAALLCALALLPFNDNADAQTAPTVTPGFSAGQLYSGPEVVLSGQASAPAGVDAVYITVRDDASGDYLQPGGGFAAAPAQLEAWTALMPPLGTPSVTWRVPMQLPDGAYTMTAVAESGGAIGLGASTPFIVDSTVVLQPVDVIAWDSDWAYYDLGDEPADIAGAAWPDLSYDDSGWQVGPAELGYGDGDEDTLLEEFPGGEKLLTAYFRHEFTVASPFDYAQYDLQLLRDDGVVLYLNGVEVGRDNMPNGNIDYNTPANGSSEQTIGGVILPGSLNAGVNVIAIEVHQAGPGSSDISFNFELVANPASTVWESNAKEGTYVLTAGDMARCGFGGDEQVAEQMDELWDSDAGIFIGLGDLAYGSGTLQEFQDCYDPTIGRHKDVTWPSAGNHEHYTVPNAAGYRAYFGNAAGPYAGPAGGLWYSFDIDDNWMGIALDSDCRGVEPLPGSINGDGCAVGSDQEIWLRNVLETNQDKNILAFFHHPPYTNNHYTDHEYTWPLWRALTEYGVELTLHGHEHHYERYAMIDYWGDRDPVYGTREFIIGSGGTYPRYDTRPQKPESDFKGTFPSGTNDFGVLQLWLRPDGYDWLWEPINGLAATDQGSSGLTEAMPRSFFTGEVIAAGAPVAGAEVCATADRTGVETCTTTLADGTYSLGLLVSDDYTIDVVDPSGTWPSLLGNQATLAAPADTVFDAVLAASEKITGTVTDASTGAPIELATVCATELATAAQTCVNTAADGTYEVTGLTGTSYFVEFTATGFVSECWDANEACTAPTAVSPGDTDIDATLELDGGSINGTVVAWDDPGGVAGVTVCADGASVSGPVCAVTLADGTYSIPGLPTGNYIVEFTPGAAYAGECYNSAACTSPNLVGVVAPGARVGIDANLQAFNPPTATPVPGNPVLSVGDYFVNQNGTVTATVALDPTTINVTSAWFTLNYNAALVTVEEASPGVGGCVPAAGVTVQLCNSQPGSLDIRVNTSGGTAPHPLITLDFDASSLTGVSPLDLLLVEMNSGQTMIFSAATDDGSITVQAGPTPTATAVPPTSTPTPVPPTPTPTSVPPTPTPTSVPPTSTPTPVGPTPTTPPSTGAGSISGMVTEFATGNPVFGAQVCVIRGLPAGQWCTFTAIDGTWTIGGLETGNYSVIVSDNTGRYVDNCWGGNACSNAEVFGLYSPNAVQGIDVQVDPVWSSGVPTPTPPPPVPDGSIAGTVTVAGAPTAGVQVCATSVIFGTELCATTDASGNYVIFPLATGNYRVDFDGDAQCYRSKDACSTFTPVGVLSPLPRTGVDASL